MAYRDGEMKPNETASAKARSKTAGPNGSFPVGTPKNARLAIGGATRSERAGHISPSEAAHIKSEARAELGEGGDMKKDDGKKAMPFGGKMAPPFGKGGKKADDAKPKMDREPRGAMKKPTERGYEKGR